MRRRGQDDASHIDQRSRTPVAASADPTSTASHVHVSHVNAARVDGSHVNASHVDDSPVDGSVDNASHVDDSPVDGSHVDDSHVDASHIDAQQRRREFL